MRLKSSRKYLLFSSIFLFFFLIILGRSRGAAAAPLAATKVERFLLAISNSTTTLSIVAPPFNSSLFTRDLTLGSAGEDVRQLQVFLNTMGFPISSVGAGSRGNETLYFGALTKRALARFQAAHNIRPSIGYFGILTRAYIQGLRF